MNTTPSSSRHSQTGAASNHPTPDQDQPQADATPREPTTGERALVLGGGGSTGNAWLIGEGLKAGERVIVEGLQKVRPGDTVKPHEVDLAAPAASAPSGPAR